MQDDEGPLGGLEAQEPALELVAVDDRRLVAGDRGFDQVRQLDVGPVPPHPSRLIDAGVDEQAVDPGVEPVGIPKRGQITPGADEGVLHRVLGLLEIPKDEPGGGIQAGDRGACQRGEGVMIAVPRSLHEFSLHLAPWRRRARSVALIEYGEGALAERSRFPRLPFGAP